AIPARGVVVSGDDTQGDVAHALELLVGGDVAGADELDPGLVQTEVAVGLHDGGRLFAGDDEGEYRVRLGVLHALPVRHEVRVGQGNAHAARDLAPAFLEALAERFLRLVARGEVVHRRVDLLELLGRPLAERIGRLPEGERHPREIRGRVGDAHAGGVGA